MTKSGAKKRAVRQSAQTQLEFPRPSSGGTGQTGPVILSKMAPAVPTEIYDTYWRFAAKRQEVFFRRAAGEAGPWTDDPILQQYKFTNAYRASDRVSQYLIREVIYGGDEAPEEVFFRTVLFKLFNRIDTWELLQQELGTISWAEYNYNHYDAILSNAHSKGVRIYSAAYIMPPTRIFGHPRKHQNHLRLLELMMWDNVPFQIQAHRTMREAFELLRSYPSLGDFLAYQFVTDINYSKLTDFSEMEFVVPGPGARDGIRKCFASLGGLTEADVIRVVTERQAEEMERLGVPFLSLWGRPLQLIDCQNLFCEVDKYARVAHPEATGRTGRTQIKQKYHPGGRSVGFWYPPKWGINEHIGTVSGGWE